MDAHQKRIINSLILDLRESLEKELELALRHYGIFVSKDWLDLDQLDFLSEEEKKIKKKFEIYIKRKEKIGLSREESTKEFITVATYNWLNRILGLKCLESRELRDEIITTRPEYSGRSIVHRNYLEEHPELKSHNDEGFFHCLFDILRQLTSEIQIIFDPDDIHISIKPRLAKLKEIIEKINSLDRKIYQNDEFLGWVYQYFHDKERDIIYKKIKDEQLKIGGSNLIPLTQLYTEDYMVKFLAQNSLGSIWMEMYPESNLCKKWEYYIPPPNNERRKIKSLEKIKILDPACGSGHFLLYLFDLLYDMYLEEGKVAAKDIPKVILENNLYGIDIDTRAIQITALVLYMKIKEKLFDENIEIPRFNLFSTDIITFKTEILNEFLNEFENDRFLKKIIVSIWSNLEDIREIGSLSQIDIEINSLIEEEIERNKTGILRFTEDRIENWQIFRKEILNKLRDFLQKAIQTFDVNKELFAKEEEKGIWLIDVFENKYDVIITNPPYLGSNKLTAKLKKIFKSLYPLSYRDLYTMFIEKIIQFLKSDGYTAIITMQNFMFINVYEKFRFYLLNTIYIKKLIHIGVNAFLEMGDHVPAIMFIFSKKLNNNLEDFLGIFFNLQDLQERKQKIDNLINPKYRSIVNQEDFRYIKGYPFVHWISEDIRNIFRNNPTIEEIAPAKAGLQTSNNERFLRFWWEVNREQIALYEINERKKWHFYAKGGIYNKWYGNLDIVVNWENDGKEIRNARNPRVQNEGFYFLKGITYTLVKSYNFNARILPKNCLFDVGGSSSFPKEGENIFFILGYLNSLLIGYILDFLNPTVNTQVGDINRLPYINPNDDLKNKVANLVKKIIQTKRELLSFDITEWEFEKTGIEYGLNNLRVISLKNSFQSYIRCKELLILRIILLKGMIEQEIFNLYNITENDKEKIYKNQGYPPILYPIIKGLDQLPNHFKSNILEFYTNRKIENISYQDLDDLGKKIKNLYEKENPSQVLENLSYISLEVEYNPISIYNIISQLELINPSDFRFEIENFLTKLIIDILNEEKSGIVLLNEPSDKDILIKRILEKFDNILGEDYTDNIVKEINNIFGKSLDDWIQKDFFKNHISQFKKRPIIWHISSENKYFQCFINYHKLSQNLLMTLRNKYVEKRLSFLREETKNIIELLKNEANDLKIKELNKKHILNEELIEDLQNFSENLKKLIDENVEFNEDNGVKQQILPFQKYNLLAVKKVV